MEGFVRASELQPDGQKYTIINWTWHWYLKYVRQGGRCGKQTCGTEPLKCGTWNCIQVDSVRIKLNCRTASWWPEDCLVVWELPLHTSELGAESLPYDSHLSIVSNSEFQNYNFSKTKESRHWIWTIAQGIF